MITDVNIVGDAVVADVISNINQEQYKISYRGILRSMLLCFDRSYYESSEAYLKAQEIKKQLK